MNLSDSNYCWQSKSDKIHEVVNATGGLSIDICGDRDVMIKSYLALAEQIKKKVTANAISFIVPTVRKIDLPKNVNYESIQIYYGNQYLKHGHLHKGWVLDDARNQILIGDQVEFKNNESKETKFTVKFDIL